jgi:hypothetical protein
MPLFVILSALPSSAALPSAPSISTITPGNGYLEVAFSEASGATDIQYSTDDGISWNNRFTGIAAGSTSVWSPITIHGLTNGQTYSVKLRGKNSEGVGTESSAVSGTPNSNSRIAADHGFLQGAYVEVGVRPNGAFGSSAGSLYGFHSSVGACLGFRVDRQKNGWGASIGTAANGFTNIDDGDYFCPGSPYEGWSLKVGSSTVAFNSHSGTGIAGRVYGIDKNATDQRVVWSGSAYNGIVVTQTSIVPNTGQSLHVDITLQNVSGETLSDVYYGRGYDPDNSTGNSSGGATSGSRNKVNNPGGTGQIAEVQAIFDSGATVYLRSTDERARAAARLSDCCNPSSAPPNEVWNTSANWIQTTDELSSADRQVAVAVKVPTLASGESTSFRISYVLTREDAASPSVSTGSATGVGAGTTATLNGSVNANGQATTVSFEYGLLSDLTGTNTSVNASESPVSGSTNTAVSASLTGLSPGTTYYYRVVAQNETGTSLGTIKSFTPIAPPIVQIEAASDLGESTATLNGYVNPQGGTAGSIIFFVDTQMDFLSGNATTYNASPASVSGITLTSVSFSVGSLSPAVTYYYKLRATNESSTETSSTLSFTTTPAPLVTTGSTTSKDVAARTISLNGSVNTYGTATGSLYFELSKSAAFSAGSSSFLIPTLAFIGAGSTGVNSLVANASTLDLGVAYYYRLFAGNTSGTNYGTAQSFILASAPTVTTGSATTSGTTASLTGEVNPNGANTTSLRFYYATSAASIGSSLAFVTASPSSATGNTTSSVTGTISGLTAGSTYYYRLVSTNSEGTANGETGQFTLGASDTTSPQAVIVVGSTASTSSTITVTISFGESTSGFSNTDLVLSGSSGGWAKGSAVAVGSSFEIVLTPSASTTGGSLILNVPAGAAEDTSRNLSLAAAAVTVSVTDDRTAPGAPTIGSAVSTGSTTANLSFTAPASNGGATITSYKAYTSSGSLLATLNQAVSGTFSITGLSVGSTYSFYVTATNTIGTSSPSANSNSITMGVSSTVPGAPTGLVATTTGESTATISFTAPTSDGGSPITSYTFTSSPGGLSATFTGAGSGTLTITGLSPGLTYTFIGYATNAVGNSSNSVTSNAVSTEAVGLTPLFGVPVSNEGGFTVNILNYDGEYSWAVSVTNGYTVTINSRGLVSVSGIANSGYEAMVTVTTSRVNYSSKSSNVLGSSRGASPESELREISPSSISAMDNSITCECGTYKYVSRGWIERAPNIQAVIHTLYLDGNAVANAVWDEGRVLASWFIPATSGSSLSAKVSRDKATWVSTTPLSFTSAYCEIQIFESPTVHRSRTPEILR